MTVSATCIGCSESIDDMYFLVVGGKYFWHLGCLKCHTCACSLQMQTKCYQISGHFYCPDDYAKLKSQKAASSVVKSEPCSSSTDSESVSCQRCRLSIGPTDYVIKIQHSADVSIYHMNCFFCQDCSRLIEPGSQYGFVNEKLYCGQHYQAWYQRSQQALTSSSNSSEADAATAELKSSASGRFQSEAKMADIDLNNNSTPVGHDVFASSSSSSPGGAFFPKKSHLGVPSQHQAAQRSGRGQYSSASGMQSAMGSAGSASSSGGGGSMSKKKRVRTSFKHQQLRAMKAYFQINPNPDAKDLKELSERTGLQKRVLQVWFQNSRAKQRKSTNSTSSSSTVNHTMSPNALSINKTLCLTYSGGNGDKADKSYNRVLSQYLDEQHGSSQLEMNPSSNNSNFLSNSNSLLFPDDDDDDESGAGDFDMSQSPGETDDSEVYDDDEATNGAGIGAEFDDSVTNKEQQQATEEGERTRHFLRLESADFDLVDQAKPSANICKEISGKIQNTSKRLKKQSSKSSAVSQAAFAKTEPPTPARSVATTVDATLNAAPIGGGGGSNEGSYHAMQTLPLNHHLVNQQNENSFNSNSFMINHETYHHQHHHHHHHQMLHFQQQQAQQQHYAPSLDYFCF